VEALMDELRDTPEVEHLGNGHEEYRLLSSHPYCKLPIDFFDLMLAKRGFCSRDTDAETKIIEIKRPRINLPSC
jgi:hypothetical protein